MNLKTEFRDYFGIEAYHAHLFLLKNNLNGFRLTTNELDIDSLVDKSMFNLI